MPIFLTLPGALAVVLMSATPADPEPTGETVVVTASRSGEAQNTDDVPASITVVDSAAIEQRQTRIVSDALRDVPGLAVNRMGGVGSFTQVRVRGTESNHVLVLVDGIEIADPFQGEFDFATLSLDDAARIEVLRGQQSALYGSDAIGGVIQYVTASGSEAPGLSARLEGGSFGTVAGSARAGGVAGTLDYAVSGSAYLTDGVPGARGGIRDIGSDSYGASAKLGWGPTAAFKLTAVARYSHLAAENNGTEFDPASPRFGQIIDSPGSHFTNEAVYGLIRADLALADGRWTNTLNAQFGDTARDGYTARGYDFGDQGQRYKGSFVSSFRLNTGEVVHRLTGAVDVERERFRARLSDFVFQAWRHTDNVGLVGQYEAQAGGLAFGASLRRDENTRFADTTTWRAQAGYRLGSGTRLRGAYGTGVKNPTYYELYGYSDARYIGNPNLKPEKSKGWEAGIDQRIAGTTIGATYFDSRLEDEIFTTYPAPDFVATPANRTSRSRQHGVEALVSAQPVNQLRFDLAYTYTRATEDGIVEVRRPRHIGSLNVTGTTRDQRFATTLTVRYNGRQGDVAFTDPSFAPVRVTLQEYVLVNLNAEFKLTPAVALFGRVENLLDERYEEVFSYATAGRSAFGGVRARL